jgi:hypothetical protein
MYNDNKIVVKAIAAVVGTRTCNITLTQLVVLVVPDDDDFLFAFAL